MSVTGAKSIKWVCLQKKLDIFGGWMPTHWGVTCSRSFI